MVGEMASMPPVLSRSAFGDSLLLKYLSAGVHLPLDSLSQGNPETTALSQQMQNPRMLRKAIWRYQLVG
jgi:hypothetical protein